MSPAPRYRRSAPSAPYTVTVNGEFLPVQPVSSEIPKSLEAPASPLQTISPAPITDSVEPVPYAPSEIASTLSTPFRPFTPPTPTEPPMAAPDVTFPDAPEGALPTTQPSALNLAKAPQPPAQPRSATPAPTATPKPTVSFRHLKTSGDPSSRLAFIVPHGDETTAQEVLSGYQQAGGEGFAAVARSSARNTNGINLNAVFKTDSPARKELESTLFGSPRDLVIALHNTRGGAMELEKSRSDAIALNDPKYGGYILTTDPGLYELLQRSPYNVILQATTTDKNNDGSLSRYSATIQQPYVNVEALRGDTGKQKAMLATVLAAYRKWRAQKIATQNLPFLDNPVMGRER